MEITLEQIKELRAISGAGVGMVKEALEQAQGDTKKAIECLREKGVAKGAKRANRQAQNGTLGMYVHNDGKLVVVVEVATETDFAAKSSDLQKFAKDIALHIAAINPVYIDINDIPEQELEAEKSQFAKDVEGKPAEIAEKILQGRLAKFYEEKVLMEQMLFSDETKKVRDYFNEMLAKIGEKLEVTRFVRLKVGEPTASCVRIQEPIII